MTSEAVRPYSRYTVGDLGGFSITLIQQDQVPYYIRPAQYAPVWQAVAAQRTQQPTVGELIIEVFVKFAIAGVRCVIVYGVWKLLEPQKRVRHCSECGRTNHTARNCSRTGPRTHLAIKKTGVCRCCGGRFRYTEGHHFAGRGVARGKEMCVSCHFHCGHNGDWYNLPVNPRYCRLAA